MVKKISLPIILFFILLMFIYSNEVPRKIYNIVSMNYYQRINNIYGFCSDNSAGFISYVITKYKLEKVPKIIKYTGVRNPHWIIHNRKEYDFNHVILIKYNSDQLIYLTQKKNSYTYNFSYRNNHKKIKKIIIYNFNKNNFIENIQLFMSDKKMYDLQIDTNNISFLKNAASIDLPNDLVDIIYRHKFEKQDFIFKINSKNNKHLENNPVALFFENEINLKDFTIKEQFDDCYYGVKND